MLKFRPPAKRCQSVSPLRDTLSRKCETHFKRGNGGFNFIRVRFNYRGFSMRGKERVFGQNVTQKKIGYQSASR